ncbi:MAG TPA: NAD-dependent epimerase/dehydratase family protein [Anaerolineae bacterium]|nr:NAD-dependent epimerase/dehydratase family protein [Anaerolineae bacterium]
MTKTALVTGSTGFIGSALCRALVTHGYTVRALHRKTSSLTALEGLPLERVVGDILEPETLRSAFEGVDWVFHTAAQSDYWRYPELVLRTAIEGTRNVMLTAREAQVERVMLTSSSAALGVPTRGELLNEDHKFNLPPNQFTYGYSKYQAEIEALKIAERGLELVILNPSIVLGPGDLNRISGTMVIEAAKGWGFFWIDGGDNYIHVTDVVTGHLSAARHGRSGERYILGGENLPHRKAFTILTEIVGRRRPWLKIPGWLIEPAATIINWVRPLVTLPFNSTQLRLSRHHLYYDTSKAQQELDLPEPLPFRQAAQEAYDWYMEQGML